MSERRRVTAAKTIVTNGHEYIDFGLPSGTLWATVNIGQDSQSLLGNFPVSFGNYNSTNIVQYYWGGSWDMPTKEQFQELIDNLVYWYTSNYSFTGLSGVCFAKSATSSAVLFFPAFGYGYYDDNDDYIPFADGEQCYYLTKSFNNYAARYAFLYFINGQPNKTPFVSDGYTSEEMNGNVRPVITP